MAKLNSKSKHISVSDSIGDPDGIAVSYKSLTANGKSKVETTTRLVLTFEPGVPGLTKKNLGFAGFSGITLTDVSSGKGETYNCDVTEIDVNDGDHVTISVATVPKGYVVTPSAKTVQVWVKEISFVSLTANGKSKEENTSELTLEFNPGFNGILPENVALSNTCTKGEFKDISGGAGTKYSLKVSKLTVNDGDKLQVTINQKPVNCELNPVSRDVQVWRKHVNFTLTADGSTLTETTKNLTLKFDKGLPGLKPENVEVVGCKCGKTAEIPGTNGSQYATPISEIAVKNGEKVTVNVKQEPVDAVLVPTSQTVPVFIQEVKFTEAIADGKSKVTTTQNIELKFDKGLPGLTVDCIAIDKATPKSIVDISTAKDGSEYVLAITNIAVKDSEKIKISIVKTPYQCTLTPTERDVVVYLRQKPRTWVQIFAAQGGSFALSNSAYTNIPVTVPYVDDSPYLHGANGGIIIDVAGDYEVTVSASYTANKEAAISFTTANNYKDPYAGAFTDVSDTLGVTTTRTIMFPDCPVGTIFTINAMSNYTGTTVKLINGTATALLVRRIEAETVKEPETKNLAVKADANYPAIRYLRLEHKDKCVYSKIAFRERHLDDGGDWTNNKYYEEHGGYTVSGRTVDLTGFGLAEGAEVKMNPDLAGANDRIADEWLKFDPDSKLKATYYITGPAGSHRMFFDGISEN
ncbi:MAG: hypothetical protein LBM87_00650 [Ruminococcus sp.]|jgi:hypothetical protein|nr:hypothetical protein [Ruminococcus sp.]